MLILLILFDLWSTLKFLQNNNYNNDDLVITIARCFLRNRKGKLKLHLGNKTSGLNSEGGLNFGGVFIAELYCMSNIIIIETAGLVCLILTMICYFFLSSKEYERKM